VPNYRRVRVPGGTFFSTVVTWERHPIFADEAARTMLGNAFRAARAARPFTIDAVCLLPDYLHALWTLPDGDADYTTRWAQIKGRFSHDYLSQKRVLSGQAPTYGGAGPVLSGQAPTYAGRVRAGRVEPRRNRGEVGVWQKRFWEHRIRDEADLRRHVDYIHYNPVKHGYAGRPADWPLSSFHRYVRLGLYEATWGETEPANLAAVSE